MTRQETVERATANIQPPSEDKGIFGFWVYLMTDCVLFASLFATYAVLHNNTFGHPSGAQLFDLRYALIETIVLLFSSFACGMTMLAAHKRSINLVRIGLVITLILGLIFLGMELNEFHNLIIAGNSWRASGFLSAFFTLVGTHGLHITIGLIWSIVMIWQVTYWGLNSATERRLTMFGLFWHFLDVIWIFIFTVVYLMAFIKVGK